MHALSTYADRFGADRGTLWWAAVVVNLELLALSAFLLFGRGRITNPLPTVVYPMLWINVSLWAVATTATPGGSPRRRRLAALVGVAYFLVLAWVGGVVSPGHAFHGHAHASGLRLQVLALPPGWNPAVYYGGSLVSVALVPYKAAGYLALSYLVYATVVDTAGTALAGVAGLFSCVSCTWPVIGTVVTGLFGGAAGVAALSHSYGLSTLVFLSAVALLYWRPSFG